ncbi:U1 small nuclear ribonucleoprotein 70 kDa-like [Hibiscus syriacus]|uniref:U1 small nuclear ribonucleoprotein 70 kDa-like n=1 Tax=Hibiscus syriacus TaxID=106335 RepID=A0A6A3CRE8_HIBSY|nr:myb family transcription factor EFM-like [Hibiscus syriacus]KAE8729709.1 U1 small nuclear ribonucleoprotein 70 kDa-like [Hibiscus syriacus]
MASPSGLTLDCKPHSYSMQLKSFGDQHNVDQTQKLEDFLSRLEEERLKIDAFKRELPLCMQLLTNAVEDSRNQLHACRANQGSRPVLEEFIPITNSSSESSDKSQNISDKANWMTSAQLWSQGGNETKPLSTITSPKETDIGFSVSPKLALDTEQRNGGAFLPFSKDRNSSPGSTLPELALASVNKDMEDKKCLESTGNDCQLRYNSRKVGNGGALVEQCKGTSCNAADGQITNNNNASLIDSQPHRKARRCWSPDLHRRFVNALQMLGGSQVATPKQIRELMKVEGLTNDEVKSHLQKYRLHTRRPSPSPQAPGAPTPQLVVLGGIWVPPDYATAAAAAHGGAPTLYGAHHPVASHAPPHFCASPVPQEFYTTAAAATPALNSPQLHHHTLQHQLHIYKATSQAHSLPELDLRGDGDRSESIENGKSESSSWKGESGDNSGDQRKGLAALREEGEESNGSEITLKF